MTAHEPEPPGAAERREPARRHVLCGGAGTPMRVLALDPSGRSRARCAGTDGVPSTVETALVGPLETGAVVLVLGGVALARLDAEFVP